MNKFIGFDQTQVYFQDEFETALIEGKSMDAKIVHEWINKQQTIDDAKVNLLAWYGKWFKPITKWESTSNELRKEHSARVARLAKELADAMEEDCAPDHPFALALFENESLARIAGHFNASSQQTVLNILDQEDDSDNATARAAYYISDGPMRLTPIPIPDNYKWPTIHEPQALPPILRRLGEYAKAALHAPKRGARPKTKSPNARVFARELSDYFEEHFKETPRNVIAACVRIKFPEIDPPPGDVTIRDWLRIRK